MKKYLMSSFFVMLLFLGGCNLNLSNLDVQKLNIKASEYMQAGQYDKAAGRLEAIIDINPDFPEAYYNLGVAYYNMKEYDKAIASFDDAILKNPNFADAYYSRAVVYEDMVYENSDEENSVEQEKTESKPDNENFLEKAKEDYQNYLKYKKDAQDKDEVTKKIDEIDKKLLENTTEE